MLLPPPLLYVTLCPCTNLWSITFIVSAEVDTTLDDEPSKVAV
jgi:hypothetical protein